MDKLPNGWPGAYDHESRTITMSEGLHDLDWVRWRCVLGHELGHAHYGDSAADGDDGERLADEFAADLLICRDAFADAVNAIGFDNNTGLAVALRVVPWVIRAYKRGRREVFLRLPPTAALAAR